MVEYIYQFMYFELSLHLWDKAHMIMVDVLLDMFHKHFIEYFHISFHDGFRSVILFLCVVWVSGRLYCDLKNEYGNVLSVSSSWNNLTCIGISSSLKVW